jgi:hypothetical protein
LPASQRFVCAAHCLDLGNTPSSPALKTSDWQVSQHAARPQARCFSATRRHPRQQVGDSCPRRSLHRHGARPGAILTAQKRAPGAGWTRWARARVTHDQTPALLAATPFRVRTSNIGFPAATLTRHSSVQLPARASGRQSGGHTDPSKPPHPTQSPPPCNGQLLRGPEPQRVPGIRAGRRWL